MIICILLFIIKDKKFDLCIYETDTKMNIFTLFKKIIFFTFIISYFIILPILLPYTFTNNFIFMVNGFLIYLLCLKPKNNLWM